MDRFAWITGSSCAKPVYDVPVYETPGFVALPSLGALVPGWLLVVPRRRMPSLSELNNQERGDLESILPEITKLLSSFKGDVYCFEHGGPIGSQMSCGVDQAHLHVVPLKFDLFKVATNRTDVRWLRQRHSEGAWPSTVSGIEYLMIRASDGRTAFGVPKLATSQWFRRLIATKIGNSNCWDYRKYPQFPTINETVSLIGAVDGSAN